MSGTYITIDLDTVTSGLGDVDAALDNLEPALRNIGEHMVASSRERFSTETDPQGVAWPDLNPLYEFGDNEKPGKKGKGKLRETDALFNSITYQVMSGEDLHVGSNMIYARIHNEGGTIKPKSASALVFEMGSKTIHAASVQIPRRQYLGFSEADIQEIQNIIFDHFQI